MRLPLHHRPTDVALRHSILGEASERTAAAVFRERFGVPAEGTLGAAGPIRVAMPDVRLGGSSAMIWAPAPPLRNSVGGTITAGNSMRAVARALRRRFHASRRWREAASPAGSKRGSGGSTKPATAGAPARSPNQSTSTSSHTSSGRQPMDKTRSARGRRVLRPLGRFVGDGYPRGRVSLRATSAGGGG
jgi:hypothetical protein